MRQPTLLYKFTEFTDASMPSKTMLAWVSTGFRRAYYHKLNWLTSNFTASDSSSDSRCFLKVLIVQTTNSNSVWKRVFLTFSLTLFLNSLRSCLLLPSSSWKNNSGLISYFLLTILKVSIRSSLSFSVLLIAVSPTVSACQYNLVPSYQ